MKEGRERTGGHSPQYHIPWLLVETAPTSPAWEQKICTMSSGLDFQLKSISLFILCHTGETRQVFPFGSRTRIFWQDRVAPPPHGCVLGNPETWQQGLPFGGRVWPGVPEYGDLPSRCTEQKDGANPPSPSLPFLRCNRRRRMARRKGSTAWNMSSFRERNCQRCTF